MKNTQITKDETNKIRENYRVLANRGSIIYFVITDMSKLGHMYFYLKKVLMVNGILLNLLSKVYSKLLANRKPREVFKFNKLNHFKLL